MSERDIVEELRAGPFISLEDGYETTEDAMHKGAQVIGELRLEILRLRAQVEAKDAQIAVLLRVKEAAEIADRMQITEQWMLGEALTAYSTWETANDTR